MFEQNAICLRIRTVGKLLLRERIWISIMKFTMSSTWLLTIDAFRNRSRQKAFKVDEDVKI